MGTECRLASPEDATELARLRWQYRTADHPLQSEDDFRRLCEAWLSKAIDSDTWIVAVSSSVEGLLNGCMYLRCVDKVPNPGAIERAWGYITSSYVSPGHRGSGIGGTLLTLLIEQGRDRGLEFLIVWPSEEAVSLYERAGFRLASEVHGRTDDYPPLELKL